MFRLFTLFAIVIGAFYFVACARTASSGGGVGGPQRIDVAVTKDGFVPSATHVKVGQPVTLVVTRKVSRTCATEIVIADYGIKQELPENQPVEVTFTPTKPGNVHYACAMNMLGGDLVAD